MSCLSGLSVAAGSHAILDEIALFHTLDDTIPDTVPDCICHRFRAAIRSDRRRRHFRLILAFSVVLLGSTARRLVLHPVAAVGRTAPGSERKAPCQIAIRITLFTKHSFRKAKAAMAEGWSAIARR